MGVYLGQLPPAELARLKAELAETLIAYFCYPRFFDYRVASLRTRPVDRSKRQEVWLYLSSVDFTAWSRVDLMSSDFQHQIERLFIHFVQRNRSFFGEQGRKRMADIRMLIGTSAAAVAQGLRGHLSGKAASSPPFGSPRPVSSWATTNVLGRPEKSWEQIAASTTLLQQQLQEVRGEIKPAVPQGEVPPVATPPRRSNTSQPAAKNPTKGIEHQATAVSHVPVHKTPVPSNGHSTNGTATLPGSKSTPPAHSGWSTSPVPSTPRVESVVLPAEHSLTPLVIGKLLNGTSAVPPSAAKIPTPVASSTAAVQQPVLTQPPSAVATTSRDSASVATGEEDMAIFEQLRHQLIVWLRIEAIRSGIDIANQGPLQLLELLRQQDASDEPRLQTVSTLLNLSNQVLKNGQASFFDYKQALTFHLMHSKR